MGLDFHYERLMPEEARSGQVLTVTLGSPVVEAGETHVHPCLEAQPSEMGSKGTRMKK